MSDSEGGMKMGPRTGRRLGAGLVMGMGLAGALTGCGSPYEEETACGIDAADAAAIIGTDKFTATEAELADAPLGEPEPRSATCLVEHDDTTLRVLADLHGRDFLETQLDALPATAPTYDLGDGVARAGSTGGTWICGNVWLQVVLTDSDSEGSEPAMRRALDALSTTLGCYIVAEQTG